MRGADERARIDHQNRAWLAWNIAFLPWMKNPPKFADLIGGGQAKVPANDTERAEAFHKAWDRIDRALERGR